MATFRATVGKIGFQHLVILLACFTGETLLSFLICLKALFNSAFLRLGTKVIQLSVLNRQLPSLHERVKAIIKNFFSSKCEKEAFFHFYCFNFNYGAKVTTINNDKTKLI